MLETNKRLFIRKVISVERGQEEEFVRKQFNLWRMNKKLNEINENEMFDNESDEEDGEEQFNLNINDMTEEEIVLKWRQHLYNIIVTRKMKNDSKELASQEEYKMT